MSRRALAVILEGVRVGTLEQSSGGGLSLAYEEAYTSSMTATPVSLSMRPEVTRWTGAVVRNWLSNLLPDNERVLERWGARFQVSPNSPFALLRHVGRDVAGAVQFVPEEDLDGLSDGGIEWLSEDEVWDRLSELRLDPAAWTHDRAAGQFSLAGAQPKVALRRDGARWGLPWGAEPTTHILKAYGQDLPHQALNEHLSLRVAYEVGLAAARSEILELGDLTAVVIERYDRIDSGRIRRVHQEDLCQALGLSPSKRYQTDAGPGIVEVVDLLRRVKGPATSQEDIERFLQAQAYAWATTATDAHSKNYSILLSGSNAVLAPLYDLQSAAPYLTGERRAVPRGKLSIHTAGLAMNVAGERLFGNITADHWRELASRIGLAGDEVVKVVERVIEQIPGAVKRVVDDGADHRSFRDSEQEFADLYEKSVTARAEFALASLRGRGPATTRRRPG